MQLSTLDLSLIIGFFAVSLIIGLYASRTSGKDSKSFFLSGRNMPWWLLGVSMVATTFAADTPNLVAGIVRQDGVYGNWVWWSFLLTGMLTVFFYARLWRRSGINTDLEFYELRYKGRSAAFLRGFRAIYLGVFFNIVIMANVCLAAIKIGHVMFGYNEWQTLLIASLVTVLYAMLGGLKGVLLTDFVQFIIAMIGSIWAAFHIVNLPQIGGIDSLMASEIVTEKSAMFPDFTDPSVVIPILLIPLAVQWWSVWYPGSEPGGGGYIAQRMLAAKNEKHATWAVLFFNVAHYAIRPWPWIMIGLASLIIYPNLDSLQAAFPNLSSNYVKNDLSYPAMLTLLPAGLLGLVVTSIVAAFMSTISTHLNWGSSYVVNDFYKRFIRPDAKERELVMIGRASTFIMMILAALLATILEEAKEAFDLMLQIGAGTGLLFIMRWFWKRINPYSEIAAMVISFLIALVFFVDGKMETPIIDIKNHWKLIIGVFITTAGWITVTLLTPETDKETMKSFNLLIFGNTSKYKGFQYKIICFFAGVAGIYAALMGIGYFIYGEFLLAGILTLIFILATVIIIRLWGKMN
jgi:SSS family solute:Na+ symporter